MKQSKAMELKNKSAQPRKIPIPQIQIVSNSIHES